MEPELHHRRTGFKRSFASEAGGVAAAGLVCGLGRHGRSRGDVADVTSKTRLWALTKKCQTHANEEHALIEILPRK